MNRISLYDYVLFDYVLKSGADRMAIYVHVAEMCESDARRHGQAVLLDHLRESVEEAQNLTGFSFFLPTPFLKKSLGRSFRLLAYRVPVDDDARIHGRVRIEHMERFETITVDGKDGLLLGDAKFSKIDTPDGQSADWEIAGWNAQVRLLDRSPGKCVVFAVEGQPFEIELS